jgi:hypothetical protein
LRILAMLQGPALRLAKDNSVRFCLSHFVPFKWLVIGRSMYFAPARMFDSACRISPSDVREQALLMRSPFSSRCLREHGTTAATSRSFVDECPRRPVVPGDGNLGASAWHQT